MYPTNSGNISTFGTLKININNAAVNNNFPDYPTKKEFTIFLAGWPEALTILSAKYRLGTKAATPPKALDIPCGQPIARLKPAVVKNIIKT